MNIKNDNDNNATPTPPPTLPCPRLWLTTKAVVVASAASSSAGRTQAMIHATIHAAPATKAIVARDTLMEISLVSDGWSLLAIGFGTLLVTLLVPIDLDGRVRDSPPLSTSWSHILPQLDAFLLMSVICYRLTGFVSDWHWISPWHTRFIDIHAGFANFVIFLVIFFYYFSQLNLIATFCVISISRNSW